MNTEFTFKNHKFLEDGTLAFAPGTYKTHNDMCYSEILGKSVNMIDLYNLENLTYTEVLFREPRYLVDGTLAFTPAKYKLFLNDTIFCLLLGKSVGLKELYTKGQLTKLGVKAVKDPKPVNVIKETSDPINPSYYRRLPFEVIDVTIHFNFCLGNALKYLMRAGFKPGNDKSQDLKKSIWYLEKQIQYWSGKPQPSVINCPRPFNFDPSIYFSYSLGNAINLIIDSCFMCASPIDSLKEAIKFIRKELGL